MIRQGFILTTAMLLSGCGYHFANQVDAYDLMPRPVTNKRFQIVPPDESIQSRMFSGRFADGLAKKRSHYFHSPARLCAQVPNQQLTGEHAV